MQVSAGMRYPKERVNVAFLGFWMKTCGDPACQSIWNPAQYYYRLLTVGLIITWGREADSVIIPCVGYGDCRHWRGIRYFLRQTEKQLAVHGSFLRSCFAFHAIVSRYSSLKFPGRVM
jgi:hypothetical protein